MMSSKINIKEILKNHFETISNNGKLIKEDKKTFFIYPLLIGLILSFFIRKPDSAIINIFAISLSIFIGLFLNLLVLIISFAENKLKVKDKKNRAILIEQTFYNITYTIIVSLLGLGLLFIANINFLPGELDIKFCYLNSFLINKGISSNIFLTVPIKAITYNTIIKAFFYLVFYSTFIHIILTLLMIVKRIFRLFKVELTEIKNKQEKPID